MTTEARGGAPATQVVAGPGSGPAGPGGQAASAGPEAGFRIAEEIDIVLPAGSRTVVVSDLHLPAVATEQSLAVADQVAAALERCDGPAAFVVAGDGFEMLAGPPDVARILDAHPRFTSAVERFTMGAGHWSVILSGNHDGQLAWDEDAVNTLSDRLGVHGFALACNLTVTTDRGPERVRIVHGNQSDPFNTFEDPWSPVDTPFGHHVVRQLLPELASRQEKASLLEGVEWLDGDPADFVGSRIFYRKIIGRLWLLTIPFVAVLLLRLLTLLPGLHVLLKHHTAGLAFAFALLVVAIVLVAGVAATATLFRVDRALRATAISARSDPHLHNAIPRAEAARIVTQGYAGMVSGHTHEPELSLVGPGFYANTGSGTMKVVGRRARFRLPHVFVTVHHFSYIEILGERELQVNLWLQEVPERSPVLLERMALAKQKQDLSSATLVGSLPEGPTWPLERPRLERWMHRRRVRRAAAAFLLVAGGLNVLFALLWRFSSTQAVDYWLPFGIHPLSVIESVVAGLILFGLAVGVRRGLRPAWIATLLVLVAITADRLVHSRLEGSAITLLYCIWLLVEHDHFRVWPSEVTQRFLLLSAAGLAVVAILAAVGSAFSGEGRTHFDVAFLIVAIGIFLALLVASLTLGGRRRTRSARHEGFERARGIIREHGGGTLDYFALRDDRSWFFSGDSFVAYTVIDGEMVVSPDPIGPTGERAEVWRDVIDMAESNRWRLSVLGATQTWLPVYRASGLVDRYVGDEAIVDCTRFSLAGKSMAVLRATCERVEESGCRVELFDGSEPVPRELHPHLLSLMETAFTGRTRPGHQMTLGRILDPRDRDVLVAVCLDRRDRPVAFNQYVPAHEIDGYCIDLVRTAYEPDAPEGVTEFVIVETIRWMSERGHRGLGLNLASTGTALRNEDGPWAGNGSSGPSSPVGATPALAGWRSNHEYGPAWHPRYAVTGPLLPLANTDASASRSRSAATATAGRPAPAS